MEENKSIKLEYLSSVKKNGGKMLVEDVGMMEDGRCIPHRLAY